MIEQETLRSMLLEHQKYHSPFQIERFIIEENSGGTDYGRYKQCLREMWARVRNIRQLQIELRRNERELTRLSRSRDRVNKNPDADLDRADIEDDIEEAGIKRDSALLTLRETARELVLFYQYATDVRKTLPDQLTPQVRDELDRDMWRGLAQQERLRKNGVTALAQHTKSSFPTMHLDTVTAEAVEDILKCCNLYLPQTL